MSYWSDQTVLITGSGRGIGSGLAQHFSKLGCQVAINYLKDEASARKTLSQCAAERTKIYQADVSTSENVDRLFRSVESDFGPVTVLINNAGQTRDSLVALMSDEKWLSTIATHLNGAFFCSRAALTEMLRRREGRIINVTSVSGIKGVSGQSNYSAAKAGLIGLTKSLAKEVGTQGITCNAIALGMIETDMTLALMPDVRAKVAAATAIGRLGKVSEVTGLAEYLAGPSASYLTGQVISLDGGLT